MFFIHVLVGSRKGRNRLSCIFIRLRNVREWPVLQSKVKRYFTKNIFIVARIVGVRQIARNVMNYLKIELPWADFLWWDAASYRMLHLGLPCSHTGQSSPLPSQAVLLTPPVSNRNFHGQLQSHLRWRDCGLFGKHYIDKLLIDCYNINW